MTKTTGTKKQRFLTLIGAGIISPSVYTWRNGKVCFAEPELEKLMALLKYIGDPLYKNYKNHPETLRRLHEYPKHYDKLVYATKEDILFNLPWIDSSDLPKIKEHFTKGTPLFFLSGFDKARELEDFDEYCDLERKYLQYANLFADNPYVNPFIMRPIRKMSWWLKWKVRRNKRRFLKISEKDYFS